jgi:hypothetical protein
MDFNQVTLFGNKTFSDLLKEIYNNSKDKEKQISSLIQGLKPLIESPGDATLIVPLIKEYMEIAVKNDEALIKMAGIVQRAMTTNTGGDDMLLSDKDKEILFQSLHELDTNVKQNEIKEVDAIKS